MRRERLFAELDEARQCPLIWITSEVPVPFVPMILKNIRLQFFIVYNLNGDDRASAISGLTVLLAGAHLAHNIGHKFPLERIAEAHDLVGRGEAIGKVIVRIE